MRITHINLSRYLSYSIVAICFFLTTSSHASVITGFGNCSYSISLFNGSTYDLASSGGCSNTEQNTSGSIEADTTPRGLLSTSAAVELTRMSNDYTSLKPLAPIVYSAYEIRKTYGDIGVATYAGASANADGIIAGNYGAGAGAYVSSTDSISVAGRNNTSNGMRTTIELDVALRAYLGDINSYANRQSGAHSTLTGYTYIYDSNSRPIYYRNFEYASPFSYPEFSANCGNFPEEHCADTFAYFEDKISFDAVVGNTYTIESQIASDSGAIINTDPNTGRLILDGNSSHTTSLNSLSTFLTPNDKDVFLISESGHDYSIQAAQAVPEPPSIYMLLTGLLFIFGSFKVRALVRCLRLDLIFDLNRSGRIGALIIQR